MAMTSLPPMLQEIANAASLPAALKLAEAKGGQRITIPGKIKEDHWLAVLVGFEDAQKISKHITNGTRISIEMPRGPTSSSAKRNFEIMERLDAGEDANHIAQVLGITRRWVLEIKSRGKNDKPTERQFPDLFDF